MSKHLSELLQLIQKMFEEFFEQETKQKSLKNKSGYVFIHCIGNDGIKLNKNKNVKR